MSGFLKGLVKFMEIGNFEDLGLPREMRLRDAGRVSNPREAGEAHGKRVLTPNLRDFCPF